MEAKGGCSSRTEVRDRRSRPPCRSLGDAEVGTQETSMTKQADLKRRVRTRMAKTGESYATARAHVLSERPAASGAAWATALHVTNGDCTVPELRATGLAHRIVCWRDALHDGPVPDAPDDELRRIRARFLAGENAADLGTTEE